MEEYFDDYIKNLKEIIKKYLLLISKEISSDLPEDLIDEIIRLLNDILRVIKKKNQKNYLKDFYNELPIKRIEYLAAALIYLILNYKENATKIKISRFAQITKLARQNIRRVLNYLASFKDILEKYKLSYNPRVTYQFDESNYINQIYSYITKYFYQIVRNLKLKTTNSRIQIEEIMNLIKNAISSVQKQNEREKLIVFYNSLEKKVRDPKYLAAAACYIYYRFINHIYIEQEDFIKILNKIENINLIYDSFSRTYSNFSENYFTVDIKLYITKIHEWLDNYIKRVNKNSKFPLELTKDFKNRAIELLDKAIENGFNIQNLSKDKYAFAQSKKLLPKFIAACLIYLTLKSYKELEDYATRDYMKELLKTELDYSRITSNQSPLYNYTTDYLGRYKYQPYSIEDFKKIINKFITFYNKIKSPHHESVLILKIFKYSELNPSDFAKRLKIHGGATNDLLKIVRKKKNFEDFSVLRKIKAFIQLNIPQENKNKAIEAYKKYRKFWIQQSHIGKSEEICRRIFEDIFNKKFKKSYLKWLKSEKGGHMHLDGYNPELQIAFEYQGKQHYFFIPKWHKTRDIFLQRQADDKWKKKLCNEKKIVLIEVPYRVKYEDMRDYIIKECKKKGILISSNEIETSGFNQSKFSLQAFEKFKNYNPKSNPEINEEENRENVEKKLSKEEMQASDSFKDIKQDTIIKENKQEHPFDQRFNKVEEEEDFNDPYLWISPKVRENIEENKEKLLEKARERIERASDSLNPKEYLNYFERGDLETNSENTFIKESSKEELVENFEPFQSIQDQTEHIPDIEQNYITEQPIEQLIEEPSEKPIDKPPEKLIDEPPDEPPEKPIDEPPEKPIDEPPDEPPEKPIDDPPDEPPDEPPEKPIDKPPELPPEIPIEEIISIISNSEVPQLADFSPSSESPTQQQNFDDDIENLGNKESYEQQNFDDDIENFGNKESYEQKHLDEDIENNDNIHDIDDSCETLDKQNPDDLESKENDDTNNYPDDLSNHLNNGECVPEAKESSSDRYSDCPDDCPSE